MKKLTPPKKSKAEVMQAIKAIGNKITKRMAEGKASEGVDFADYSTVSESEINEVKNLAASGLLDGEMYVELDKAAFNRSMSTSHSRERKEIALTAFHLAQNNGLRFPVDAVYDRMASVLANCHCSAKEFIDMAKFLQDTMKNKKMVIENNDRAAWFIIEMMMRIKINSNKISGKEKLDTVAEIARAAAVFNSSGGTVKLTESAAESYDRGIMSFAETFTGAKDGAIAGNHLVADLIFALRRNQSTARG